MQCEPETRKSSSWELFFSLASWLVQGGWSVLSPRPWFIVETPREGLKDVRETPCTLYACTQQPAADPQQEECYTFVCQRRHENPPLMMLWWVATTHPPIPSVRANPANYARSHNLSSAIFPLKVGGFLSTNSAHHCLQTHSPYRVAQQQKQQQQQQRCPSHWCGMRSQPWPGSLFESRGQHGFPTEAAAIRGRLGRETPHKNGRFDSDSFFSHIRFESDSNQLNSCFRTCDAPDSSPRFAPFRGVSAAVAAGKSSSFLQNICK